MEKNISRRRFLKNSAATSVSLIIGLNSKGILATNKTNTVINPFVRMDEEGFVTVIAKHYENGQGISTGLATLLAEEMDADWEKVKVEFAPANAEQYKHTFWGYQATGNSESIANSFMQYRAAGAMAKDLMIRAASKKWGVTTDEIDVHLSHEHTNYLWLQLDDAEDLITFEQEKELLRSAREHLRSSGRNL